jgi:hypothetical protein
VNALGTVQPEQLIFTNQRGHPIRDVEILAVMDFEEDDDDAVMPVLDPVDIGRVSSSHEWMFQGKPHKPLRLMISTFCNLIHL